MKKHITYITTNLINGKQYVGDHSTNDLNDSYLGSGKLILKAIKKYGKENFKREIIKISESKEEAFDLQEKYINEYNTLKPKGYNLSPKGGHNVKDCFSEESKTKISESLKKTYKEKPELKENLREKATGRKASKKTLKTLKQRDRSNWKISKEGLENIKKSASKPKSEEHKKNISVAKKGVNMSEETKRKISNSTKGIPKPNENFGVGENHINAKTSDKQVLEILELIEKGVKISIIAKQYNVTVQTIYNYKKNKSRKIKNND